MERRLLGTAVLLVVAMAREPVLREEAPPPIAWELEIDGALERAARTAKPSLLFFRADWDCAAKELEHVTFPDARVRRALAGFVTVKVDVTDEESDRVQRAVRAFGVLGDPTLIVRRADGSELTRIHEFVQPEQLLRILEAAGAEVPAEPVF